MTIINKFKELPKEKQKEIIIFGIICLFSLAFLILSITLLSLGASDYKLFIKQVNPENQPNISVFVYGLFFSVLSLLSWVTIALYGNHVFNKKLMNQV